MRPVYADTLQLTVNIPGRLLILPPTHNIGAHVDLTVIRAEGVTAKRLHAWPDVIGQPIDPFRDEQPAGETGIPHDDGTMFDDGTGHVNS